MFNPFKKKYNEEELKLITFLSDVSPFTELAEDELAIFIPYMYLRTYHKDEVVFFSGDPSHALYLVKKGKIQLSIDVNERSENLLQVNQGRSFGDNALLENTKRIYNTIVISEMAELYVIPKINLIEIMQSNPTIKAKIMTLFASNYNRYTSDLFKTYKSHFGFFELGKVYTHNS